MKLKFNKRTKRICYNTGLKTFDLMTNLEQSRTDCISLNKYRKMTISSKIECNIDIIDKLISITDNRDIDCKIDGHQLYLLHNEDNTFQIQGYFPRYFWKGLIKLIND